MTQFISTVRFSVKQDFIEEFIKREKELDYTEMAEQVTTTMNELPDKHLSKAMFYKHIRSHMRQQKVVLSNLLNDLLEVAQSTTHACVCVCSETDTRVVDPKMLQAYLKTVDSIMAIYRSDALKERRD